ncbi:MAG: hypothetical protein U1F77_04685 [Kiritimatiellia bacterium]
MTRLRRFAAALLLTSALAARGATVLVEAESFTSTGGWKIDTQAVEQMGSVYAIAHGMGVSVADASTTVPFPAAGSYRVWVRTRNWVPGTWTAPGPLPTVGGGNHPGEGLRRGHGRLAVAGRRDGDGDGNLRGGRVEGPDRV